MLYKKACVQCILEQRQKLLAEKKDAVEKCWQRALDEYQKYQSGDSHFYGALLETAKAAKGFHFAFDDDYFDEGIHKKWSEDEQICCPLFKKGKIPMSIHDAPPDGCPYVADHLLYDQKFE